ncbi:alpha-(1-_3)-arabinofuranosyltransferase family protein, partial [uncultured Corynebacterium sp.]|uniref:alpha-(1->3)-arabinofuranosyltransferase domain-containing protein n=1 Tax=uncultured Corynebacterium sp. TaxID=159447 RepID=UPI0025FD2FEF
MKRLSTGVHLPAWLLLGVLVFLQPVGQVAADTKLDLLLDPAGFLSGAMHAWTDDFTLGQLQNQAYGYLFPQGFFFLLTDFLPDWITQRLWWWVVLGIGFSGFYLLLSKLSIGAIPLRVIAATLYALSPRTLTTLTAISSETWPAMVAPWICIPLLASRITARQIALSLLPVAALGAVNATATLAALIPAAVIIAYRRRWLPGIAWSAGVLAINSWWIGPLLVLGRYAPPFTEFIESAAVTTNWLNPVEILRGTTSWTPFVDTERQAGYLLVNTKLFVILTILVAAFGLAGLALMRRRGLWVLMLAVGLLILGSAQLDMVQSFLDGPGAALRNIHKFDLLVRMPLMVGVAALGAHLTFPQTLAPSRREAVSVLVVLVAVGSIAPAWSGRMLPRGTWDEVPSYWYEATDFLNQEAAGTRTLILPSSPFARQDWGWTR